MRYEQDAEPTKLYWRNRTRNFSAMPLHLLLNRAMRKVFLFHGKSRAILLNDKLNELGAQTHLPVAELAREQEFRIRILSLQQQFGLLTEADKQYNKLQQDLLAAKRV